MNVVGAVRRRPERLVALVVVLGLLLVPLISGSSYLASLGGNIAFDAILALTATLLIGYGGQFSFAFPIFVGLGAYISAWLSLHTHLPSVLEIVAGGVFSAAVGVVLSYGALRFRGLQLGILTLALVLSGVEIFNNVAGVDGIAGVPPLYVGSVAMTSAYQQLLVYVGVLIIVYAIVTLLTQRRFGRLLLLIKADEDTAMSLGLNVSLHKRVAFGAHALLLGLFGGIYPFLLGYVGSDLFSLDVGLNIFFAAVLGGLLFPEGAIVGALLFSIVPLIAGSQAVSVEPLLYGVILLVALVVLPTGVMGVLPRQRKKASRSAADLVPSVTPSAPITPPMRVEPLPDGVPALRIEHLKKSFGGLQAVKDVSLEVARGEIVGLIGNNGAGKSTIINMTCGYLRQDGGKVFFGGEDVGRWSADRRARAGLHRTFQFPTLIGELSVADNLRVGAEASRHPYGKMDAAVPDVTAQTLTLLGLDPVADSRVDELSLGLQKIVDVARALMTRPKVLLLDEPAAGLSPAEVPVMAKALRLARAEGLSLVIVEHNVPFVLGLVDKVTVLDYGSVLAVGTPQEIVEDAAVIEAYLGRAAEGAGNA
jgi:ABC-type branched-subunit amino acid transport system ATPase component/ABC-type branched-subunit amino acid transport system permease subunit